MLRILYCAAASVLVVFLAVSCRPGEGIPPEEVAGRAAKVYYDYLAQGNCEAFVDGFYQPDSIPSVYREQLVTSARMLARKLKTDHGGLKGIEVGRAVADTARHAGRAFLVLCFADGTREEIVVPLVLCGDSWMLR